MLYSNIMIVYSILSAHKYVRPRVDRVELDLSAAHLYVTCEAARSIPKRYLYLTDAVSPNFWSVSDQKTQV